MEAVYSWEKVEALLAQRQMTKTELAERLGMNRGGLWKIQNGDYSFRKANALAIAYVLGVKVEELEADRELVRG